MSGDSRDEDSPEWRWAHIMWQRHNMRMEEFAFLPRDVQIAYIASELLENEEPVASITQIRNGLMKKKQ